MGSSPPKAPDPKEQAAAQRSENIWSSQYNTIASNANQYTPYGSVTSAPGAKIPIYDEKGNVTGYGNQWNQTTTLSPVQQKLFDTQNTNQQSFGDLVTQQIAGAKDYFAKPVDTKGLTPWQTYSMAPKLSQANYGKDPGLVQAQYGKDTLQKANYGKDPSLIQADYQGTDRQAIEDAIMASTRRAAQPGWAAEDAQMAARGMGGPGSEMAYATDQARGDVMAEAGRGAYLASGAESRAAEDATRQKADFINAITQAERGEARARTGFDNTVVQGLSDEARTRAGFANDITTADRSEARLRAEMINKIAQAGWSNSNLGVDQANALRSNQWTERLAERTQRLNEMATLMGGSQATVPQGQAFQGSQVNPFDIAGAMDREYQYNQQAYQNKQNGLFGLAGGALNMLKPFSMFGGVP